MGYMKHTAILGLPRTGKTTIAMQILSTCNHDCILINSQWEDYLELCANAKITPRESTILDSYKKNSFKDLEGFTIINTDDYTEVFSILHDAFAYQRASKKLYPVTIAVDEAHLYFPYDMSTDKNDPEWMATRDLFTRGLKYNLRIILITQKPQLMCAKVYTLCERIIAFKLHPNDYTYFRRHNINIDPVTEKFKFVVME